MTPVVDAGSFGPVDVACFVFADERLPDPVVSELARLQESGTVRIIDLSFVTKDSAGGVTVTEAEDAHVGDAFAGINASHLDLLSDGDLNAVASALVPDTSALVVVWEHTWADAFRAAIRASGGEPAALERIPREVVAEALAALADDEEE